MGMQSTPPGSIVLARNRSRSLGVDLAGLGEDVGGVTRFEAGILVSPSPYPRFGHALQD